MEFCPVPCNTPIPLVGFEAVRVPELVSTEVVCSSVPLPKLATALLLIFEIVIFVP